MQERRVKKILVTFNYRGKSGWMMVAARKVGRNYQITPEAYKEILVRSGAGYGHTITIG